MVFFFSFSLSSVTSITLGFYLSKYILYIVAPFQSKYYNRLEMKFDNLEKQRNCKYPIMVLI